MTGHEACSDGPQNKPVSGGKTGRRLRASNGQDFPLTLRQRLRSPQPIAHLIRDGRNTMPPSTMQWRATLEMCEHIKEPVPPSRPAGTEVVFRIRRSGRRQPCREHQATTSACQSPRHAD